MFDSYTSVDLSLLYIVVACECSGLSWLTYPMLVLRDGDFRNLKPSDIMRASYVENEHVRYSWVCT